MIKLKNLWVIAAVVFPFFIGTAQEKSDKELVVEKIESSFSVEINESTSVKDFEFLKKTFKEDFNTEFIYENAQYVEDKLVEIKITLRNEKQSFIKSIANGTKPISPFTITLKQVDDQDYQIVMAQEIEFKDFESFYTRSSELAPDFSKMVEEMNGMTREIHSILQNMMEVFNDKDIDKKLN